MPTEKLNCSLVYRRRYNNQSIAFVRPQGWRHYPKSKISAIFKVLTELFSIAQFFIIHLTLPFDTHDSSNNKINFCFVKIHNLHEKLHLINFYKTKKYPCETGISYKSKKNIKKITKVC